MRQTGRCVTSGRRAVFSKHSKTHINVSDWLRRAGIALALALAYIPFPTNLIYVPTCVQKGAYKKRNDIESTMSPKTLTHKTIFECLCVLSVSHRNDAISFNSMLDGLFLCWTD